jgi:hypothetical protein
MEFQLGLDLRLKATWCPPLELLSHRPDTLKEYFNVNVGEIWRHPPAEPRLSPTIPSQLDCLDADISQICKTKGEGLNADLIFFGQLFENLAISFQQIEVFSF